VATSNGSVSCKASDPVDKTSEETEGDVSKLLGVDGSCGNVLEAYITKGLTYLFY
jgi:hypothetical protein